MITRVASLSDAIGCRGFLVHAESDQARGLNVHLLLLKDIRRTLGR